MQNIVIMYVNRSTRPYRQFDQVSHKIRSPNEKVESKRRITEKRRHRFHNPAPNQSSSQKEPKPLPTFMRVPLRHPTNRGSRKWMSPAEFLTRFSVGRSPRITCRASARLPVNHRRVSNTPQPPLPRRPRAAFGQERQNLNRTLLETTAVTAAALAKQSALDIVQKPSAGCGGYFVINNRYKIITANTMYYAYEIFINLSPRQQNTALTWNRSWRGWILPARSASPQCAESLSKSGLF